MKLVLPVCEEAELNIERRRSEELEHEKKSSEVKGTLKERKRIMEMNKR
jgi:hypothetical protein